MRGLARAGAAAAACGVVSREVVIYGVMARSRVMNLSKNASLGLIGAGVALVLIALIEHFTVTVEILPHLAIILIVLALISRWPRRVELLYGRAGALACVREVSAQRTLKAVDVTNQGRRSGSVVGGMVVGRIMT